MSCRRAREIDLLAFAVDRQDPEWAAFRAHYPTCPDCSRAVAQVGGLIAGLAAQGSGAAHPDDDLLLDYEAGTLGTAERTRIDDHLAGCAACRTELGVLRGFSPEAARALAPAVSRAGEAPTRTVGWMDRLVIWLRPGPAFAIATAAMLVLAVVWWSAREERVEPGEVRFAEQAAPPTPPKPSPTPDDRGLAAPTHETTPTGAQADTTTRLAERPSAPSPAPPSPETAREPAQQLAERGEEDGAPESPRGGDPNAVPAPTELARREARPSSEAGENAVEASGPGADARSDPARGVGGEREVVLLAAHFPTEIPRYSDPAAFAGQELDVLRSSVVVRGAGSAQPELSVLAPKRVGITRAASPRLYWAVDRAIEGPVEIVVQDPEADSPALSKRLDGPFEAGLHAIDLAAEGVTLRMGRDYEWSVAIPAPEGGADQDVVSLAGVRRVAAVAADAGSDRAQASEAPQTSRAASERGTSDEAARARRVHELAAAGDWYDAFDQTHRWLEQAPEVDRLHAYQRALLEQVELGGVATWIDAAAAAGQ